MTAIPNPNKAIARAAGFLYLIMIICGMGAQFIYGDLIVADNAAAMISNIAASA